MEVICLTGDNKYKTCDQNLYQERASPKTNNSADFFKIWANIRKIILSYFH